VFRARPDAVEVIPGLLVGSAPSRRQVPTLVAEGVTTVIDLRSPREPHGVHWPEGIVYARIPFEDHGSPSADDLEEAGRTVAALMRQGDTVLVHCHAGLERSPTVACAALVISGWSLAEAYRRVTERRRDAAPTAGQMATLEELASRLESAGLTGQRGGAAADALVRFRPKSC
jgi:protein-tyrosine phosphatase